MSTRIARRALASGFGLAVVLALGAGCKDGATPGAGAAPAAEAPAPATPEPKARAGPKAPRIVLRAFDDPGQALSTLLAEARPRVLGVGEIHQSRAQAGVPSAIKRFGQTMIGALQNKATDLIVETWISEGGCGETEKQVVEQVEQTTERPAATENEIVTLLKRAQGLGIRPHILHASCADYEIISGKGGEVDYERLLELTTDKLRDKSLAVLAGPGAPEQERPGLLVVYGGAVHNDAAPEPGLDVFAYAPRVRARVGGRYAELDLWVPEYVAGDPEITGSAAYHKALTRIDQGKTLLLTLGVGRYVIVFPKSASRPRKMPGGIGLR